MTRFLAVGDVHMGAGVEYGREPGDRLRDQEAVWARCLDLAVEHDVDCVLFAGDAFHRRRPTPAEMIAFQRPLQRFAAEHDIEVVAISGNHDCEAADLPTALDVFGREVDLYTQPGIWHADGASVACLPWTPVSRLVATRNGGGDRDDLNREAAELLVAAARGLRTQIPAGQPAVLMTHFSISGASTPTGVLTDDFREVVLPLEDLEALGFDAIIAGHIHLPDVLNGPFDGGRPIFYVGSPLPVDFGEGGSAHGCWLLEVGEGDTRTTFLPIASRPFVTLDVDELADESYALVIGDASAAGMLDDAVVRMRIRADEAIARNIDVGAIRKVLMEAGAHKVYNVQFDVVRENRARVEHVNEDIEPLAAVDAWCEANAISDEHSEALAELTSAYLQDVGAA